MLSGSNHWKMKETTKRFGGRTHSKKITASEQNYFDRLPAELIISIFARISDAKCLCSCFSVSKSFAEHILQTRSVSAEIPYLSRSDWNAFRPYSIGQPGERLAVWPSGVINFLKKLTLVESATIRFSLCPSSRGQPLVWWKSDGFGFMLVSAEGHDVPSSTCLIMEQLSAFKWRFLYVEELVFNLPNLKYLSAVDSMKQGKIVMGEEAIANMRKEKGGVMFPTSFWIAPEVKLPLSGCVLKNVILILTSEWGACHDSTAGNLVEENREYGELAVTLMKNRHTFRFFSFSLADVQYPLRAKSVLHAKIIRFHRYH